MLSLLPLTPTLSPEGRGRKIIGKKKREEDRPLEIS
jgi:hypothetical protein